MTAFKSGLMLIGAACGMQVATQRKHVTDGTQVATQRKNATDEQKANILLKLVHIHLLFEILI